MKEITLKSGNTLEVQPADFDTAWDLFQAVSTELGDLLATAQSLLKAAAPEADAGFDPAVLLGAVCRLLASKKVSAQVWRCLAACLYNSDKITPKTFDDPARRPDFLPCVVEVFKVNVVPFIGGLDLKFFTSQAAKLATQK
jgi:hypothetical protein